MNLQQKANDKLRRAVWFFVGFATVGYIIIEVWK